MIKVSIIIEEAELPLEFVKELIQKGMVDNIELPPTKVETEPVKHKEKAKLLINKITSRHLYSFIKNTVIIDLSKMYTSKNLCKKYIDKQKEQYDISDVVETKIHQRIKKGIRKLHQQLGPDYTMIMERPSKVLQIAFYGVEPKDLLNL